MPTSLYNFQYVPLTGRLPGKSFVSQTEQAINGLAQYVYDNSTNYEAVKAIAQKAEEDSSSALSTSEEALDKAQTALETVGRAYIKTTSAVDLDDYFDSELLLILSTESTNLPANISGYLTVMSSDTHDYCMQVYIGIDGSVYKRTATISDNTPTFGAWSETPITMSSLQTILADYAKANASNVGVNAQTDNSVAWGNAIGGGEIASGEQRLITGGTVYPLSVDVDIAQKDITNIKALLQGHLYDYQTDSTSGYTKTVPSGAMPYAGIEKVGGKTIVYNQLCGNNVLPSSVTYIGDGTYKINGTISDATYPVLSAIKTVAGHKYYLYLNTGLYAQNNVTLYNNEQGLALYGSDIISTAVQTATGSDFIFFKIDAGTYNNVVVKAKTIDLTMMFGSGNEPSTTTEVELMFLPDSMYSYNEGSLLSAGVTDVGFIRNLFVKEAFFTLIDGVTIVDGAYRFWASSGYTLYTPTYDTNPSQTYTGSVLTISFDIKTENSSHAGKIVNIGIRRPNNTSAYQFDISLTTSFVHYSATIQNAENCKVYFSYENNAPVLVKNFQITRTATEIPYEGTPTTVYTIPSEVQALEGYGWSAGTAYNYVDFEAKKFVQNVARVDLGSFSWVKAVDGNNGNRFYSAEFLNTYKVTPINVVGNFICPKYVSQPINYVTSHSDSSIGIYTNKAINIKDNAYDDATAFKSAMSGVYLYYELETPVEIDISAYLTDDNLIQVESGGTLTFPNSNGDDYRLPVPSEETYMINLQSAL